jgi:hypothetical protein
MGGGTNVTLIQYGAILTTFFYFIFKIFFSTMRELISVLTQTTSLSRRS